MKAKYVVFLVSIVVTGLLAQPGMGQTESVQPAGEDPDVWAEVVAESAGSVAPRPQPENLLAAEAPVAAPAASVAPAPRVVPESVPDLVQSVRALAIEPAEASIDIISLREDVDTMAGVIERVMQRRMRGHFQPSNLFERGVQGWYVQGLGVFFICEVDFDVATPPEEPGAEGKEKKRDLWDEVRSSRKNPQQGAMMGMGGMGMGGMGMGGYEMSSPDEAPGGGGMGGGYGRGMGYGDEAVGMYGIVGSWGEANQERPMLLGDLDDAIIETMHSYGRRIRGLQRGESIVVAVFGGETGGPSSPFEFYGGVGMMGLPDPLEGAERTVEEAVQRLSEEEDRAMAAEDALGAARDEIEAAKVKLQLTEQKLSIAKSRHEAGTADQMQLLDMRAEVDEAVRALRARERQYEAAQRSYERQSEALKKRRDEWEKAEASLELAEGAKGEQEMVIQQLQDQLEELQEKKAELQETKTALDDKDARKKLNENRDLVVQVQRELVKAQAKAFKAQSGMMGGFMGAGGPMGMGMGMGMMGVPPTETGQQSVRTYRVRCAELLPSGSAEDRKKRTPIFAY